MSHEKRVLVLGWVAIVVAVSGCGDDADEPVLDAAVLDARLVDAAVLDARLVDADGIDARRTDAGIADAGFRDVVGGDAGPSRNTIQIRWSADTTSAEVPAGGTCNLRNAVLDSAERTEGSASMRFTSPTGDVQGSFGCGDFPQTTLSIDWNSGQWLCMYFDMKVDSDFDWNVNQRKIKAQRMVNSGRWTMYLNDDGIDISECPTCDGCTGGDRCTVMGYDMRPSSAGGVNPVESWQSYTIGIQLESASGADDGQMKLWVNGDLVDSATDQTYCASCSGPIVGAWGSFGMRLFPQSPDGILWLDDFLMTAGPDECPPRP